MQILWIVTNFPKPGHVTEKNSERNMLVIKVKKLYSCSAKQLPKQTKNLTYFCTISKTQISPSGSCKRTAL